MEDKYCVVCKQRITDDDDYFKVKLFMKGKLSGTDHAHRMCWINQNNMNNNIKELVSGGLQLLKSSGINKEEEHVVVIR